MRHHPAGAHTLRHQARHRPADLRDRHAYQQETQPGKNETNFRILKVKGNFALFQSSHCAFILIFRRMVKYLKSKLCQKLFYFTLDKIE